MQALSVIIPDERPALALELPDGTSFDEWVAIGRRLCLTNQALQWHIGDWWAFGDHRYGERARAAAEGLFGLEFKTLRNLAVVSRRFETSRRRDTLTFTHHAEVATLPPAQADELLVKAEREHVSANFLRREVQAIKAANDPAPPTEQGPTVAETDVQLTTAQSMQAKAIGFAEDVIELCEIVEKTRRLKRRESDMLTRAQLFVQQARGRRETYKVPETFEIMFKEQGRVACERIFDVSRVTVNHWLIQCGKRRLIEERADFVRFRRDMDHPRPVERNAAVDLPPIDEALHAIAKQAAHFLRVSRYGGWMITANDDGTWLVGTVRKSSDELIAMAERQGFDSVDATATLRADAAEGVEA